jgi:hypothetical protein
MPSTARVSIYPNFPSSHRLITGNAHRITSRTTSTAPGMKQPTITSAGTPQAPLGRWVSASTAFWVNWLMVRNPSRG